MFMWERALKIGLSSTGFIGYVGFGLLSLALNIGLSTGCIGHFGFGLLSLASNNGFISPVSYN